MPSLFSRVPGVAGTPHASRPPARPVRQRLLAAVLTVLGVTAMATAWAIVSPPGASPDERAHIVYAYGVATGQTLPANERLVPADVGPAHTRVSVPAPLVEISTCYAFDLARPADCSPPDLTDQVQTTTYHTRYPPPYYLLEGLVLRAGLAAGLDGEATIILARAVSGALCLTLVCAAARMLLRRFDPPAAVVAVVATLTPTALSLFSAVNPNGVEIAAAVLTAATVVSARDDYDRLGRVPGAVQAALVLSFGVLAWSRPLSLAWAGLLFLVLVWPLRGRPEGRAQLWRRPGAGALGAVVAILLAALLWVAYAYATRNVTTNAEDTDAWGGVPLAARIPMVLAKFGDLVYQSVAAMGWDINLPRVFVYSWFVAAAAFFWTARAGTTRSRRAGTAAVWYLLGSAVVVAMYSLLTGFGWQGRYWLPALAAFLVLLVPALEAPRRPDGTTSRLVVGSLLAFGTVQLLAFVWSMWRYVYGLQVWYDRFDRVPVPLVPPGWGPIWNQDGALALYGIGVVALAAAAWLQLRHRPGQQPGQVPAQQPQRPV